MNRVLSDGLQFAFGQTGVADHGSDGGRDPIGVLRIACHELVSPLSTIQLCAQSLVTRVRSIPRPSEAELWEMAQRIETVAVRAVQLIDDVLAVDRQGEDRCLSPRHETIDVERALDEALALHAEALDRAGCSVFVTRSDDLGPATDGAWKRQSLERLFSNLLQNVARHAAGSDVVIHLSTEGQWFRVRFADHGPGLVGSTGRHGLGLWIIHRTVTELGGQIEMESVPGVGLAFEIKLPI
jgi:signal transduction histidine kinase